MNQKKHKNYCLLNNMKPCKGKTLLEERWKSLIWQWKSEIIWNDEWLQIYEKNNEKQVEIAKRYIYMKRKSTHQIIIILMIIF